MWVHTKCKQNEIHSPVFLNPKHVPLDENVYFKQSKMFIGGQAENVDSNIFSS